MCLNATQKNNTSTILLKLAIQIKLSNSKQFILPLINFTRNVDTGQLVYISVKESLQFINQVSHKFSLNDLEPNV